MAATFRARPEIFTAEITQAITEPVLEPVTDPETGLPVLDEDGLPVQREVQREVQPAGWRVWSTYDATPVHMTDEAFRERFYPDGPEGEELLAQ